MKQSNTAMWVIIVVLVIALIGIAGVLVYQLGRRSVGDDLNNAISGNETTQTADGFKRATFNAAAAEIYATNTAVAIQNFATQTAAAWTQTPTP